MRIAILACVLLSVAAERSLKNYHLFSVKCDTQRMANLLINEEEKPTILGIDFWNEPMKDMATNVRISVPPYSVGLLKLFLTKANATFEVLETDIEQKFREQVEGRKPYTPGNVMDFDYFSYHPYEEIMDWLMDMHAAYPHLTEVVHVGWSLEEREIKGLKITGNATNPNKKKILTNYCIHSREWLSPATGVYMAGQLLEQYARSAEIRFLVDNIEFTFVPVTNPDGYHYTWTNDRLWRKTRSPNAGSTCVGTDPNRNWGVAWSQPGASNNPCSDSYYGAAAFSEVETRALSNYLATHGPFQGYIDVHCCGNMWMTPWGFTYNHPTPEDYSQQMEMNVKVTNALRSVRGTQYAYGPIADVIYQASGSTVDWTYGELGILYSVAVELSGTFVSPASIIGETIPEVFAAFKEYAFVVLNH